jgi:hypothetical protein
MTDRYVIVYRDGSQSFFSTDKADADRQMQNIAARHRLPGDGLAYRIRIREKAKPLTPGVDWRGAESVYRPDPFHNLLAPGFVAR